MALNPTWWELLRALWPVFTVIAGLAIGGIVLALKTTFATVPALKKHDDRIVAVETFVIEQKTAIGILPTRQQLSEAILSQGREMTKMRETLSEAIAEQGERIAGVEAAMGGMSDQLKTSNGYLHTIIEQGMRR